MRVNRHDMRLLVRQENGASLVIDRILPQTLSRHQADTDYKLCALSNSYHYPSILMLDVQAL